MVGNNREFQQPIKFEYKSKFFQKCQQLGHKCEFRKKQLRWVPKKMPHVVAPNTPAPLISEAVITLEAQLKKVSSNNEAGWQASSKVVRRSMGKSLLLSGASRGFEVLVRENLDVLSVRILGLDSGVVP